MTLCLYKRMLQKRQPVPYKSFLPEGHGNFGGESGDAETHGPLVWRGIGVPSGDRRTGHGIGRLPAPTAPPMGAAGTDPRGGTASLAGLRLSLAPPVLELSGLAIEGPPHEGDLLRLDLLRFELIPGRLFHDGPWLRHVEARGLVFERPRPHEAKGAPDLTPLTRLFDIEDLSLTDARLRVALPKAISRPTGSV